MAAPPEDGERQTLDISEQEEELYGRALTCAVHQIPGMMWAKAGDWALLASEEGEVMCGHRLIDGTVEDIPVAWRGQNVLGGGGSSEHLLPAIQQLEMTCLPENVDLRQLPHLERLVVIEHACRSRECAFDSLNRHDWRTDAMCHACRGCGDAEAPVWFRSHCVDGGGEIHPKLHHVVVMGSTTLVRASAQWNVPTLQIGCFQVQAEGKAEGDMDLDLDLDLSTLHRVRRLYLDGPLVRHLPPTVQKVRTQFATLLRARALATYAAWTRQAPDCAFELEDEHEMPQICTYLQCSKGVVARPGHALAPLLEKLQRVLASRVRSKHFFDAQQLWGAIQRHDTLQLQHAATPAATPAPPKCGCTGKGKGKGRAAAAVHLGHDQVVDLRDLACGMLIRNVDAMNAAQLKQSIWRVTSLKKPEIILQKQPQGVSAELAMMDGRRKKKHSPRKSRKKKKRTTELEMGKVAVGIARTEARLLQAAEARRGKPSAQPPQMGARQ